MFWIAIDDNDRVIGSIGTKIISKNEMWLKKLYVKSTMKRQGIGKMLYKKAQEFAVRKGIYSIYTRFTSDHIEAQKFYPSIGFIETAPYEMVKHLIKRVGFNMNDEIVIRALEELDLDKALDLWKISFNAGFSEGFDTKEIMIKYLNRNPGFSSVACTKYGKIVGALMCGHDGRRGSIYHTAVYREYRNKGIGRRMEQRSLEE